NRLAAVFRRAGTRAAADRYRNHDVFRSRVGIVDRVEGLACRRRRIRRIREPIPGFDRRLVVQIALDQDVERVRYGVIWAVLDDLNSNALSPIPGVGLA